MGVGLRSFRNVSSCRTLALAAGTAVLLVGSARALATAIDWDVHADAETVVILHTDEDGNGFGDVLATLVRGRPAIFRLEAR